MKRLLVAFAVAALAALGTAQYAKQGVRLMKRIPLADFPGDPTSGAGCAGYVSASGQEYACMGVRNGTVIVRVTDPANPVQVAHIPGLLSTWHEMTVLGNYLYSVADSVNQGMQIIDLSRVDENIVELKSTYTTDGLGRVHTIQANPVTKTLYLNGSNLGFVILDATNPENPIELARWGTKYVHDSQIVTYTTGPYAGKEVAFLCCGGAGLYVLDITDRADLKVMSNVPYLTGSYYTHSGQLTPDRKYFLINDEFDERNELTTNATTHIVNVEDLAAPRYEGPFVNPINAIDHNTHLTGRYMYLAAYRSGLRIYDVSNPMGIVETGFFDTYPPVGQNTGEGFSYDGAWGTFSFPSGTTIVSDINRGLFVLDPTEAAGLGAPLITVTPTIGTILSGNLKSLRESDENFLQLRWVRGNGGTTVPTCQIVVDAATTVTPSQFVDLRVGALQMRNTSTSVRAELWNWTTNAYETVGTYTASKATPEGVFSGQLGSKFVSSTGAIRMRVTATIDNAPANTTKEHVNFLVTRADVRRS